MNAPQLVSTAPDILKAIVALKRREVDRLKSEAPLASLQARAASRPSALSLSAALRGGTVRIIAEIKKASPSKGLLRADFDPAGLAETYVRNGAAAVSVLTNDRFQGSIEHLDAVQAVAFPAGTPVLRKEFVFDPYQVVEARAHGADAVLLIVAMLPKAELRRLMETSRDCGMECLVEVHDEAELDTALEVDATIIGINNRDLRTFRTDLETTDRLAAAVPAGKIVVSESGISTRADVARVRRAGAHAALVGESLMRAADPGAKLKELL